MSLFIQLHVVLLLSRNADGKDIYLCPRTRSSGVIRGPWFNLPKISHFVRDDSPLFSHSESFGHAQDKLREESFFCRESVHIENEPLLIRDERAASVDEIKLSSPRIDRRGCPPDRGRRSRRSGRLWEARLCRRWRRRPAPLPPRP